MVSLIIASQYLGVESLPFFQTGRSPIPGVPSVAGSSQRQQWNPPSQAVLEMPHLFRRQCAATHIHDDQIGLFQYGHTRNGVPILRLRTKKSNPEIIGQLPFGEFRQRFGGAIFVFGNEEHDMLLGGLQPQADRNPDNPNPKSD